MFLSDWKYSLNLSDRGVVPAGFLTFCAEAGARGEAGHVHNLYGKLLACVPVDAAPHHAEGTPATQTPQISQSHTW